MATKVFEIKAAPGGTAGTFSAIIYRVNGPADTQGDVVLAGAIEDGHRVKTSLFNHDTEMFPDTEPGGDATLHHSGATVVAVGVTYDSPRGRQLRALLKEGGSAQEWSIAFSVLASHPPSPEESARWPGVKRVIERWDPSEISPVTSGACGSACHTVGAKCAGECANCEREAVIKELARFEALKAQLLLPELARQMEELAPFVAAEDRQIPPSEIPAEVRRAAGWAVKCGALLAQGREVPIVWFARDVTGMRGFAARGTPIYLRSVDDPEGAVYAAAHEAGHVAGLVGEDECNRIAESALLGWRALKAKRPQPTPMPTTYWALLRAMQSGT